jgi:hypothetical protein
MDLQEYLIKKYGYQYGMKLFYDKFLRSVNNFEATTKTLKENKRKIIVINNVQRNGC